MSIIIVANGVIMVGNANWIPRGRPGAAPVYTVRIRNMSPGPVSYQFFTN